MKDKLFAITNIAILEISNISAKVELTVEDVTKDPVIYQQSKITTTQKLNRPWDYGLVHLLKNMVSELRYGDQEVLRLSHGDFLLNHKFNIPDEMIRSVQEHLHSLNEDATEFMTAMFKICGYVNPRIIRFTIHPGNSNKHLIRFGYLDSTGTDVFSKSDEDLEEVLLDEIAIMHAEWFGIAPAHAYIDGAFHRNFTKEELFEWYRIQYQPSEMVNKMPPQWENYLTTKMASGEIDLYNPDILSAACQTHVQTPKADK